MTEIKRAEYRVERMATDVAECTGAEIPPAAPPKRQVRRMVGSISRGAEPQVPDQRLWYRGHVCGAIDALRPVFLEEAVRGAIGPGVDLAHRADGAVPNHLAEAARFLG